MDAVTILIIIALIAATALCAAGIWAMRELVLTARSLRTLSDDTQERLIPLLDKADVTVDAVNAELLRVDGVITTFEDAGVRISSASGTLSEMVHAPSTIVNEVAGRVRRAWKDRRRDSERDHVQTDPVADVDLTVVDSDQ